MAPQKSPAFQFYAKDFLTGTASMSLQEVGAYIRLLAYQWDAGSVPSDPNERARILGCAKAQERDLWKKVCKKFVLTDGVFVNERMEDERRKQTEYRRRQSDNGRASSLAKAHKRANEASTTVEPPLQPNVNEASTEPQPPLQPDGNQTSTLQSSSSSSLKTTHTHRERVSGQTNGANPPGSLPRDHRFHVVCGARRRVCLSEKTGADLVADWGGDPSDALEVLQRFCNELEAEIGDGPKGNHLWLLEHFDAFKVRNGRIPVAAVKPEKSAASGVSAAIDAWGTDD